MAPWPPRRPESPYLPMIDDKSYYAILQVDESAAPETIDGAFQRLSSIYQPGVSADSHARMRLRDLREAYAVLSSSDLRRAYDARLRRRAARAKSEPPPLAEASQEFFITAVSVAPRQRAVRAGAALVTPPHSFLAWLSYSRRSGDAIKFKIAKTLDPYAVLSTLKQRVPASDRRYDPRTQEWQVPVHYEHVVRELFLNYDLLLASQQHASPVTATYPSLKSILDAAAPHPLPPRKLYNRHPTRRTMYAPRMVWSPLIVTGLVVALLYNLLLLTGGPDAPASPVLVISATAPAELTPIAIPRPTLPPVLFPVQTRYQSVHLRAGPARSFASQGYLYVGETYTATARTVDGGWLLVSSGVITGWSAAWTLTITDGLAFLPVAGELLTATQPGPAIPPP